MALCVQSWIFLHWQLCSLEIYWVWLSFIARTQLPRSFLNAGIWILFLFSFFSFLFLFYFLVQLSQWTTISNREKELLSMLFTGTLGCCGSWWAIDSFTHQSLEFFSWPLPSKLMEEQSTYKVVKFPPEICNKLLGTSLRLLADKSLQRRNTEEYYFKSNTRPIYLRREDVWLRAWQL